MESYLAGVDQTAAVFPLGALHLASSMIDVLSRFSSADTRDKHRYEWFVESYFPSQYARDGLPAQLYIGLRNSGLHYLSVGRGLALMDGQMDRAMHLKSDEQGRTIIRLEGFLRDLRRAVQRWEDDVRRDDALRTRVLAKEQRNPVFEVVMIQVRGVLDGVTLAPVTSAATTFSASASAAVIPARSPRMTRKTDSQYTAHGPAEPRSTAHSCRTRAVPTASYTSCRSRPLPLSRRRDDAARGGRAAVGRDASTGQSPRERPTLV